MLTVEQALDRILAAIAPLPAVEMPLMEARGLALAEDAVASAPIPTFAASAMDGYAVRAEDIQAAGEAAPVALRVVDEAAAGVPANRPVEPGEAARIFTGAPVPPGADAVVMQEFTRREGDTVLVCAPTRANRHIRPIGNDVARGDVVLPAGTALTPSALGMLAAMGRATATVFRRPRVGILSTGDELAAPGDALRPGQIYDSNRVSLCAQALEAGAEVAASVHAPDDAGAIRAALAGFEGLDAILSSGGVSVGDHDLVKPILDEDGEVGFWKVAIKPGKPLAFGHFRGVPLFGLPGNPVSATITFEVFVRPALRRMMGHGEVLRPALAATLEEGFSRKPGRREYMRASLRLEDGRLRTRLVGAQDSAVMSGMARADALLVVPEDVERLEAGDTVRVLPLRAA